MKNQEHMNHQEEHRDEKKELIDSKREDMSDEEDTARFEGVFDPQNEKKWLKRVDRVQKLVDRMYEGDVRAIEYGMKCPGTLIRQNAITAIVECRVVNKHLIELMQEMENDETKTWDYRAVGDYAKAALDILGIKSYEGDDPYVLEMIEDKMQF